MIARCARLRRRHPRQIYRGIIPFVLLQLTGLLAVGLFPQIALWLPRIAY